MELWAYIINNEASLQDEKISEKTIKRVRKQSGDAALHVFFPIFTAILILVAIINLFDDHGLLATCILALSIFLPVTIHELKYNEFIGCYAKVVEKETRYILCGPRTGYLPYSKSLSPDEVKIKRFSILSSYEKRFYCSVMINDRLYEHVCCDSRDFKNIQIGDTVIAYANNGTAVIYSQ